jgi:Icc-related predicted phosphoesterase
VGRTGEVRVAAVADLHLRAAVRGYFRPALTGLAGRADLLLLAGDLTNGGTPQEAGLLGEEIADLPVPAVAVLGNHDHDEGYGDQIASILEDAGVRVLDGTAVTIDVAGTRVGVAGVMGGAGGFPGHFATHDPNPEHDARIRRGPVDARRLRSALDVLDCDVVIALTHFAPVLDTVLGEPPEIYPGLGCHALAEAIDEGGVDLAVHGHAHHGSECGQTVGGVAVRNVAHTVLRSPCAVYRLVDEQVSRLPDDRFPPVPAAGHTPTST